MSYQQSEEEVMDFEEYVGCEARDLFGPNTVIPDEVMEILQIYKEDYQTQIENNGVINRNLNHEISLMIANNINNTIRDIVYLSFITQEIEENGYALNPYSVFTKLISTFVFIETDDIALTSIKNFVREENENKNEFKINNIDFI